MPFLNPKRLKVWITAADSFIAHNILEQLDYDFITTTHEQLDLTSSEAVNAFLRPLYFDYVIHTACIGGRRNGTDDQTIFDDNYNMFENLLTNQNHYTYLINIGSGADQLDTWYGKAKYVIAEIIKEHTNMINIRCFGVWGKHEKPDRFPTYCRTHDKVVIDEDKLMRYIHVDGLVKIVDSIIQKWPTMKREMILGEPVLLSEFARQLNPNIKVVIKGKGKDYV